MTHTTIIKLCYDIVPEKIRELRENGYVIGIISNQGGIASGIKTENEIKVIWTILVICRLNLKLFSIYLAETVWCLSLTITTSVASQLLEYSNFSSPVSPIHSQRITLSSVEMLVKVFPISSFHFSQLWSDRSILRPQLRHSVLHSQFCVSRVYFTSSNPLSSSLSRYRFPSHRSELHHRYECSPWKKSTFSRACFACRSAILRKINFLQGVLEALLACGPANIENTEEMFEGRREISEKTSFGGFRQLQSVTQRFYLSVCWI